MKYYSKGFLLALAGVVITLLWIGVFKFTPTEAAAISPLVQSHPLMSWTLGVFSEQTVSNLIGIVEIVIALGLVVGLFVPRVGLVAAVGAIATFVMTISFLATVPGLWKVADGVLVTEFFFFKDVVFLGTSIHYLTQTLLKIKEGAPAMTRETSMVGCQ